MLAEDARKIAKNQWSEWHTIKLNSVPDQNPLLKERKDEVGVYLIRSKEKIHRLKGISDIIYVGKGVLRNRIGKALAYYRGQKKCPYYSRMLSLFLVELNLDLSFSYLVTESAEQLERLILKEYENDHYELPPLNHIRSGSMKEYMK